MTEDTIAALATPLGEGGLAVVRVSGREAVARVNRCFRGPGNRDAGLEGVASHTLHYGHIYRDGLLVDEVLVAVMRAPRTFTREDVVEVSCHGGVVVARAVLETVLASGVRLAGPGEFTLRAFLNGRIDLAQAEAVADVVHARTDLALRAAQEQLAGGLSRRIERLREDVMEVLAHVEAHIDFPDEDIAPDTREQLMGRLGLAVEFVDGLLATAAEGQLLRRGIRVAIVGLPNVGKSSLLNLLLGRDRAIVSAQPGTTRDTLEEGANIRGIPVVFVDTAGLRESEDVIEQEGVRRSHRSVEQADVILHVLDGSRGLREEDRQHLGAWGGRKRVVVRNKMDLEQRLELPDGLDAVVVGLSAVTGEGIEALKDAIRSLVWSGGVGGEMLEVMINARHKDALERSRGGLVRGLEALGADRPLDLVALDLRAAVQAVGEVVGKTTTDDLLDRIFSRFCLGK
ncbi:MAG: tRNA modification GTPase MnmE [Verrucomicrobiota bacterium]